MTERLTAIQTALEPVQVKIVEPQSFLERFNKLYERISRRAYEIFESNGRKFGHDLEDWFQAESEILPSFDLQIKEKENSLIVEAEVPGFSAKELEVSLEPWRLTISGNKEMKEAQGKTTYRESSDQFLRLIDLPSEIDTRKASATLKNGFLEITVPKVGEAITKRIEVKAA
jgi:HSP20 family protein